MKIVHEGVEYNTAYFPFFRVSKDEEYSEYCIRYPSGITDTVLIVDEDEKYKEFETHLLYLLREYALEEDDALTERARRLKDDVKRLFEID